MPPLHVLILAAGAGKRMRSAQPKLLHECAGLPLVEHVVRAVAALEADSVHVVVRPGDEAIREALAGFPVSFAVQQAPRGTGDAIAAGCAALDDGPATVLVVNGDCPGVLPSTLRRVVAERDGAAAALLVVSPPDAAAYGRVVCDADGNPVRIVEATDASSEELAIGEVNGGIYCFELAALRTVLDTIDADNAQQERYATDLIAAISRHDGGVRAVRHDDSEEAHGVNSRAELARAESLLRGRALDGLMDAGVTVRDPLSTYVDVDVVVGADTILHPGVILQGDTRIGAACDIGPRVRVTRSRLGDNIQVFDGSVVEHSTIDDGASIGPYARLRPGSDIGPRAKVGNFVETKATRLGAGSKASHLSYLGDARIGDNVNIGAGTITCNYDGVNKHETIIGDGAFIGSNTALVAPVRIGAGAYVGAGSTITEDVPDGSLGLGRGRQVNKDGWAANND